jgi:hypothetical protein
MGMMVQPYRFAGAANDPYWTSTVVLLGFDGADGATVYADESYVARGNAQATGNGQIDTADFKFGSASALFDGAGDSFGYLDNADFEFGTGAFTLEAWVKTNTVTGTHAIFSKSAGVGNRSWILRHNGATLEWLVSLDSGITISTVDVSGGTLTTGTWHFVAFDYDTSKYRMYLDGSMVGSSTTGRTLFNGSASFLVGLLGAGGSGFDGWIDEVRVTKGVARYASDGGHTVPTAAFPRS